jgi:hypothetical protein
MPQSTQMLLPIWQRWQAGLVPHGSRTDTSAPHGLAMALEYSQLCLSALQYMLDWLEHEHVFLLYEPLSQTS